VADKIIKQRKAIALYTDGNDKIKLVISAKLHSLNGQTPYFSLTAAGYVNGRESFGGCCHEEILAQRPDFKIIADLHLSNEDGEPMHAAANGWYWMAGAIGDITGEEYHGGSGRDGKDSEACLQIWADHVRVDIDTARALRSIMVAGMLPSDAQKVRDAFTAEYGPIVHERHAWVETYTIEKQARLENKKAAIPAKELHAALIEGCRPRWKNEAEAGKKFLDANVS
jgi:hypothetical protein